MPDRSRNRPRDLNQLAKGIVDDATNEDRRDEPVGDGKDLPRSSWAGAVA